MIQELRFDRVAKTVTLLTDNRALEASLDQRFPRIPGSKSWEVEPNQLPASRAAARVRASSEKSESKSLLARAASFGAALGSTAVRGWAPDDVVARRRLSCFGDGTATNPECPAITRDARGSFCAECGCGRNPFAELGVKLKLHRVECPRERPGFSNSISS